MCVCVLSIFSLCVYMQSLHYWELRYLLLPKQCPTPPPHSASSEQRKQEEESLISNFVRFLEFLNRIKKGVAVSRRASVQSLVSHILYMV